MLNVITLFSGYDSQALALNRLGIEYDLAAWCEIDKHAITAHNALFPQWRERNLGDISKVDWQAFKADHPEPIDLLTYSSPCQDFSSAGQQRGGDEGSGTRSGLLWEVEKAIVALKPKHLVFENVAALVSDKFIDVFNKWQARLNGYGYTNFAQLMNAKDYGVPQNRLRIFMVSILDCPRAYYFPKPFRLERRLKDVLEQNVAERYYLKEESVKRLFSANKEMFEKGNGFSFKPSMPPHDDIATSLMVTHGWRRDDNFVAEPCIFNRPHGYFGGDINKEYNPAIAATEARVHKWVIEPTIYGLPHGYYEGDIYTEKDGMPKIAEPQINTLGNLYDNNEQAGRIYDANGISPTLDNMASGGNKSPKIVEPTIASMKSRDKDNPTGVRTANNGNFAQRLEPSADQSTSNTITSVAKDNLLIEPSILTPVRTEYGKAIRKQYGDNNIPESRHNLTSLQPKQDGTSNTLTSVAKDNYLMEPGIRIRRLTERELYRLMDVDEADIDTLLAAPPRRTQHAKLAGNSIVVACLYHIFRNLFVDTEPAAGVQTKFF